MQTVLHKDGDQYAIVTTVENEQDFRQQFSEALASTIGTVDAGDLAFEIEAWTKPAYEIVCKLRGYKSEVIEQRTLIAGHLDPDSPFISVGRSNGQPVATS